jgi:SAM-dependent methyltransferase
MPMDLDLRAARSLRRSWDRQQQAGIEDREERFAAMLDAVSSAVGSRFRFLDVGSGTGSLSERVLRRFSGARGVAVDFDPVLLKLARVGLRPWAARLRWAEVDLRRSDWSHALPAGRFDAAISTTALHWLAPTDLARVYRDIARRLRRGGIFLNGDAIAFPATEPELAKVARAVRFRGRPDRWAGPWERWWAAIEKDPRFTAEVELRRVRFPGGHTHVPPTDLPGHFRRLRAAGFREVDLVWSRGANRVLAAIR